MKRNIVGPQIRKLRYQRGWSQAKLAAKLQLRGWDISRASVANREGQRNTVRDFQLLYFSLVLGVSLEKLFPTIDSKKPTYEIIHNLLK